MAEIENDLGARHQTFNVLGYAGNLYAMMPRPNDVVFAKGTVPSLLGLPTNCAERQVDEETPETNECRSQAHSRPRKFGAIEKLDTVPHGGNEFASRFHVPRAGTIISWGWVDFASLNVN